MAARGLEEREEAAPVLWGGPLVVELVGLEVPEAAAVRDWERVAEATVELAPDDGTMEAEAWVLEMALLSAAEAEEAAEAAADEAEARADEAADEAALPDPPVRGNWPE